MAGKRKRFGELRRRLLSKRCAESYGVKRAQTMMGLKFRDAVVPSEEDFKEASVREKIYAIKLTPR